MLKFSWKLVSVVLAVCLGVSLFVSVEVFALGSAGDIILDDESWFNGNVTVTGVGTFGSVVSGQGLYPNVQIYNGSLPAIVPVVYGLYNGVGSSETYDAWYKPYFSTNDTYGTAVNLNGAFKYFDMVSIYGDKVFITGRNYVNETYAKIIYTNGTTFKDWVQFT